MGLYDSKIEYITIGEFIENFKREYKKDLNEYDFIKLALKKLLNIYLNFTYRDGVIKPKGSSGRSHWIARIGYDTGTDLIKNNRKTLFSSDTDEMKIITDNFKSIEHIDIDIFSTNNKDINTTGLIRALEHTGKKYRDDINIIEKLEFSGYFKAEIISNNEELNYTIQKILKNMFANGYFHCELFRYKNEKSGIQIGADYNKTNHLNIEDASVEIKNSIYVKTDEAEQLFNQLEILKPFLKESLLNNEFENKLKELNNEVNALKRQLKVEKNKNIELSKEKKERQFRSDLIESYQSTIAGLLLFIGKMNDFKGMSRPLQTIQTKTGLADKIIYHLENDQDEFSAKSNILYRNIINKVLEYIKK